METRDRLTLEELLTAFDEHLRRTRGVCPGTRRDYARFVRAFVRTVFADGPVGVAEIHARDVVEFVAALTCRYRPGTVELAASALRSFLRFLRAEGFGCHRPVARAFQPRRHPSVPRSRSRRQGNSPPATGRPQSHTNTIPPRRPTPRIPARPLIMCTHTIGNHHAERGPPTELHITTN